MHRAFETVYRSTGLAALVLLVACANPPGLVPYAEWRQMDPPPRIDVRDAPIVHAVNFEPGSTSLSAAEASAVAGFLSAESVEPGESVKLEAPSAGAADTDRIARRLATVRNALEQQGISVTMAPPAAPGTLGPDQIRVVASGPMVVDPPCPGYNEPVSSYDRFGRPTMNMGCSNEINLGLMVADPNDLVRGRPLAPADAERSSLAIQKYRTGTQGEEGGASAGSGVSLVPLAIGTGGGAQ
ncbi:MAG TPA: CpaD family pilus assembly lipoprotein [Alphaproteobacteria bacterium]|nr:CpaD family pilus assembly lipoprotein [Alphaproteobacteria bacterium]